MTISYNWLMDYLPEPLDPEKLSQILTSIGLEVEELTRYESVRGGLRGLVVGEVLDCQPHPNADKLKVTKVHVGGTEPLQIVCGASNVATGQKVVVAPVGVTIYPTTGEPITLRKAAIRKVDSEGMICAEDEIGLGTSHEGILVLPNNLAPGTPLPDVFQPYEDWVYTIGLTPNRMDAMSHAGVARDVCAYLTHHIKETKCHQQQVNGFKPDLPESTITVRVNDPEACPRYAGVTIRGVQVGDSPDWLKNRLMAIGQRSINNIVDITNYLLHDTGQPLHAFDAAAIEGNEVIVQKLSEGTPFITLDEKERKLSSEDLMICHANGPMCIGGVFGGKHSGVSAQTSSIFLESAWFHPTGIRKTSLRHELRTDAAGRFEKGVDISQTVNVLKRAALLIKEVAGGLIEGEIVDIYPQPVEKNEVGLKYHYLKKLSGKNYHMEAVKKILGSLGFEVVREGMDEIRFAVPLHKTDISLPADLVEEIVRIDGLDNIDIPASITISPSLDPLSVKERLKEKLAQFLSGRSGMEICTNSITNSKYYAADEQTDGVAMINSLSADLNWMRPSMLETGLEVISYNINRKNSRLFLYEWGKTYHTTNEQGYREVEHLAVYLTGDRTTEHWREKPQSTDYYFANGIAAGLIGCLGVEARFEPGAAGTTMIKYGNRELGKMVEVSSHKLAAFDIRQQVVMIDLYMQELLDLLAGNRIRYREVNKFPVMQRDLSMVVDSQRTYGELEAAVASLRLPLLKRHSLFDVFESDKLGAGKKSMAMSFFFSDEEKTLTDKEVDKMMSQLISRLEKEVQAEIRK
jgi:phenylalanyl-tRNA synthetase beta chain